MTTIRLILGDQLSHSIASLADAHPSGDVILLCEVWDEATYVRHHKKKIAFLFSAMRHFAEELIEKGHWVEYTKLDDPANSGSLRGEVARAIERHKADRIIVTFPGELRVLAEMQLWQSLFDIAVEIRPDSRFLCSPEAFARWAKGRKQMRMEYFYREMRKSLAILLDGDQPAGGQWNYDADNRQPPMDGLDIPPPSAFEPDAISQEVMAMVARRFSNHFGDLEPFYFAVTRHQALVVLERFVTERLPHFGDYQDAMLEGEPWMFHSHISFYLNCGLLLPLECIQAAERAYRDGRAPLNAVEGFVRQILGWREYVRGIYWLTMPDYSKANFLQADRALPTFYWTANTQMNCVRQCVLETKANAYAHHIQRLMVLGNFGVIKSGFGADEEDPLLSLAVF